MLLAASVISGVGAYFLGRIADQGLANFFGEVTFRHGTHPLAWLSIHILGAHPRVSNLKRDWFFLSRVSGYLLQSRKWASTLNPYILARSNSLFSTDDFLQKCSLPFRFSAPISLLTAVILPSIRIRMSQEQVEKMTPGDMTLEVCTDRWISPLNMGTPGTLWNALHWRTIPRMWHEKMRVITGIAQLAIAGAVAYYVMTKMPDSIANHRNALIAGAVLGMI